MRYEPATLGEHIDCLARLTGAPDGFVDQVRMLFTSKGISLNADATPFLKALEDAFRREEDIRHSASHAKRTIARTQQDFRKVGKAYVDQISQMKKMQSSLREKTQRLRNQSATKRDDVTHVTIKGDHRTFVTRFERENLPMVPGPEGPQ